MRTITKDELDIILEKHKSYLVGVDGGEKADLSGADLIYADLHGADLYGADLYCADLSGANLSHANLHGANLIYANLRGADLRGANLIYADLSHAYLIGANLSHANLRGADLSYADLSHAHLSGADLIYANLRGADLRGADLSHAHLSGAILSGTYFDEKEQCRKGVILKKPMMGYKKLADGSICVLSIPKGAIVFSINGSKCRTNKAKVMEGGGVSHYDNEFTYEKGKSYEIEGFDLAYNEECSTGIHFFKKRKEAEEYVD